VTPKSTKHAPTKGEERLLPVNAVGNGFSGRNREESKNGLHVAKSNAGRSAVLHDEESKPDPVIRTDPTLQDNATRDDTSKRKARSIRTHTGSERTAKRPKNKQDRPPMSDSEGDPLNDEDRKPAAKNTSPTPDGVPSTRPSNDEDSKPAAKQASPIPDGAPSTCAGFKRKSTSTRTGSMVSTSVQGIKTEDVIKTETVPVPETAPSNPATDQAEVPVPTEPASNVPNLNRTVTVHRKVAKRTDRLYIAPPPNIAAPLPLSQQAEAEAARGIAAPDISEDLPIPDTPPSTTTVDVSTSRRSRRQIQFTPIETREAELDDSDAFDDADYVGDGDDGDLSGPVPAPTAIVNAPTRRRSSRRVVPTSSTSTPIPPPPGTVNAPTRRRNSRSVISTSSTRYAYLSCCCCCCCYDPSSKPTPDPAPTNQKERGTAG
jgi:hypothetical protein